MSVREPGPANSLFVNKWHTSVFSRLEFHCHQLTVSKVLNSLYLTGWRDAKTRFELSQHTNMFFNWWMMHLVYADERVFFLSPSPALGLPSLFISCWVRIRPLCSSRLSGGDTRYAGCSYRSNTGRGERTCFIGSTQGLKRLHGYGNKLRISGAFQIKVVALGENTCTWHIYT